jgi:Dyp-type peroxidase family
MRREPARFGRAEASEPSMAGTPSGSPRSVRRSPDRPRDPLKLTGCPLEAVEIKGGELRPRPRAGCPAADTSDWRGRDAYFNPPETGDRLVETSHVHRVNQNRGAGTTAAGHRIFRQGYEYLEDLGPDGPRLGLNFVSFQSDLQQLQQAWAGRLARRRQLRRAQATRARRAPSPQLLSLRAGGFYAVPPRETPFPGVGLLAPDPTPHSRARPGRVEPHRGA